MRFWLFTVGREWFIAEPGRAWQARSTGIGADVSRSALLERLRRMAPADEFVVIEDE